MTDLKIIQLCKERNPLGQKKLVHQYSPMLMAHAFRYTLSRDDSKDVLQDTFIQIFEKIDLYDPSKGAILPWLKSICVNQALMHLRKKKSIKTNREKYTIHQGENLDCRIVNTSMETEDLYKMVLMLPEQQRLVFNLSAMEGYSHREIAEKLEITESHSRTVLTRARTQLKQIFENRNSHKIRYYERS